MRLNLDPSQLGLTAEVDQVLDGMSENASACQQLARLGDERLLAVHYPAGYGGRGMTLAHHAAVALRIGERGLPDVAHLVTVQGVGCTILAYGSARQRARWLPEIAGGRLLASLLLSEREAGSDLTRIETTATPEGDGWRIRGVKAWSLHADWSGIALCSAVSRADGNRYERISLFLVDLTAPGVTVTPVPRLAPEPYFLVELDDVYVDADALLGPLHKGWALLPAAIGFERGGFDYLTRGTSWLRAAIQEYRRLPADTQEAMAADLARLRSGLDNARALALHAAYTAEGLHVDEVLTAYTKLACGRAAQAVAQWVGAQLLPSSSGEGRGARCAALRAAVAEAPELTISGGPQDLQLGLIANDFPIGSAIR
jgi:alkylation response protein AidB-like acyl-CoA dehydrogenase